MPASISELIIARMMEAMRGQGIEKVFRAKTSATKQEPGEVIVSIRFAGEEQPSYFSDHIVNRRMQVDISASVRSDAPDQALDETRQAVVRGLMADRELGGLCVRVIEGATQMSFDDGQPPIGELAMNFEVLYNAPPGSLARRIS